VPVEFRLDDVADGGHIAPLELKTGKQTGTVYPIEHRAQVILYMLLMAERYGMQT